MSDIAHLKAATKDNDFVILDTETTDKYPSTARIVQIAVIDSAGNTLLDTLVNPQVPITNSWIHGITDDHVKFSPTFAEVHQQLFDVLFGKQLIVYNVDYDVPLLQYEARRYELTGPLTTYMGAACAMKAYAEHAGDWHPYYQNFKFQKLTDAVKKTSYILPEGMKPHSALADCLMTLAVCRYLEKLP